MMLRSAFFLLSPLLISSAWASNVLELVSDNFDKHVFAGIPSLVEFYAPWCGHCKNLAPVYEEVADAFAAHKDKVQIIKVDADGEGRAAGTTYGVQGFPTLFWFDGKSKEPVKYEGGRDYDSIANFITEKSGARAKAKPPPATVQLDVGNFNKIVMDKSKDVLVAFTATWCGHCKAMKPDYEKVALTFLPESNCVVANFEADAEKNKALAAQYKIESFPTIKFFSKDNKDKPEDYDGGRSAEDFVTYLNEKCGTFRSSAGGLNELAGRHPDFDALAAKFFAAESGARAEIYKEATTLAKTAGAAANHYIKVMEKVANNTDAYLTKEKTRLQSILSKRALSPAKLDEIKIKSNILAQFAAQKAKETEEDISEKVEEVAHKAKEEL